MFWIIHTIIFKALITWMTLKGAAASQSCAACKYQRRRCLPECKLAPYFPGDKPTRFQNVHRLYGVCNVLKFLKQVDQSQRSELMRSIIYESDMRHKYPVLGCYGVIQYLVCQIQVLEEQLHTLRLQIDMRFMQQQQQNKEQTSINHLVRLRQDYEMVPTNNIYSENDLTDGFNCGYNFEEFLILQPPAEEKEKEIVFKNNNNLMDRFEMIELHNDHQQDVPSQRQQHLEKGCIESLSYRMRAVSKMREHDLESTNSFMNGHGRELHLK